MEGREKWVLIRIRFFGLLFLAVFSLVAVRAYHLQVRCQDDWVERAERQHQRVIPLTPQRGTIYDRNGEGLALSIETDSIYVNPAEVEEPARVADYLADALQLPKSGLQAKLKAKKNFLWIKRQVSPSESSLVRAMDFPGIHFIKEHKRYYPNGELGAQVIGFTGLDPHGLEGLELKYDAQILGDGGFLVTERDNRGRGIGAGDPLINQGRFGASLHLTLDKNIQYIVEKELAAEVKAQKARAGTAVVLDPATGKILAMASQPDFNPNSFARYRQKNYRNRAVADAYEPGSTLKVFLVAAALNENLVTPGKIFDCERGNYRVGGKVIHDHHPYEKLSVSEILKFSSNIGAAKIGKALERERLFKYLSEFGFGELTGIEAPGESRGLLRSPEDWFEVDLAAISFGQGLMVTPLQLATATAAIANGGYLMQPYLVEKVVDSNGQVVERRQPRIQRRVVSAEVAQQVSEMMETATDDGGTGTLANVAGYEVAGKTGTAQKVDPVTGGYSVDKRLSSFVGFVPAKDPKLVILVMIDEPKKKTYGGLVAAPVFSRIASQALTHMQIPPTLQVRRDQNRPLPEVEENPPIQPTVYQARNGNDQPRMPGLIGMSFRQVLQTMERTKLNIKLQGSGRVVAQSPQPGGEITYGSEVWVRLEQPFVQAF
jgi:cell division protein FtsI (penicillin-binding protein 3)